MSLYARRGVHGQTVETLARRVLSGEIPEGATLDLPGLRRELGVSLTSLRESLKVLAAKGMVDARQKRGTYVRDRADWNLLDADVLRWRFDAAPDSGAAAGLLGDLDEVRAVVEPAAARLAAARRTDEDLRALQDAVTATAAAGGDPGAALGARLAFHRALLTATGNELLQRMDGVIASGLTARDRRAGAADPAVGLLAVLDALRDRDPDRAESAVRLLLAGSAEGRPGQDT